MITIYLERAPVEFDNVVSVVPYDNYSLVFSFKEKTEKGESLREVTFDKEKIIGYSISEELIK